MSFIKNGLCIINTEIADQYQLINTALNTPENPLVRWTGNSIAENSQARTMLFPLFNENPGKWLYVSQYTKTFTQETIFNITNDKNTWPDVLQDLLDMPRTDANKIVHLKIIVLNKGFTVTKAIKEHLPWKELNMLSIALTTDVHHKVRVYETHERERVILTTNVSPEFNLKLISIMPFLFKDFLKASDLTLEMSKLIGEDKDQEWAAKYIPWLKSLKLMEKALKEKCTKLLNVTRVRTINSLKSTISNARDSIRQYENAIRDYYKNMVTSTTALKAMELTQDEDPTDFIDFLTTNKCITSTTPSGNSNLVFQIRAPLVYTEQDQAENIFKNQRSDLYHYGPKTEWAYLLWKACFIDCTYRIYTRAKISVNFENFEITARYDEVKYDYPDHTHHPHLGLRQCWGDNKSVITKAFAEGNPIGGIEQIIAAVKNLNMWDGVVIQDMLDEWKALKNSDEPVIENCETGEMLSLKQWREAHETN